MKKKLLITFQIISAILLLAGFWLWQWSRNILEVENASGKNIKEVTAVICSTNYRINDLDVGQAEQISFHVKGDSGFLVKVSFADGSETEGAFGYVTGGAGSYHNRAKVTIFSDKIEGKQEY